MNQTIQIAGCPIKHSFNYIILLFFSNGRKCKLFPVSQAAINKISFFNDMYFKIYSLKKWVSLNQFMSEILLNTPKNENIVSLVKQVADLWFTFHFVNISQNTPKVKLVTTNSYNISCYNHKQIPGNRFLIERPSICIS